MIQATDFVPAATSANLNEILEAIRSQERVCVFIDNSNLYHCLKNQGNKRIDFGKLTDIVSNGRKASIRFYYSTPPDQNPGDDSVRKRNQFYGKLNELFGFHLIDLPLSVIQTGNDQQEYKEKGLDCEVVYDMATLSKTGKFDAFVLVSGDADYARTVRRIQDETGIDVEVAFFRDFCSSKLMNESSDFIGLEEFPELFREEEPRYVRKFSHS